MLRFLTVQGVGAPNFHIVQGSVVFLVIEKSKQTLTDSSSVLH